MKGQGANIGNLNFENSMRQSEIQSNAGASYDGGYSKGEDQPGVYLSSQNQHQYNPPKGISGANYSDFEGEEEMMIRPDEEQHEHADGDEIEDGEHDYDIEDSDEDGVEEDEEEQDEEAYENEQRFLRSLVKVQALIRGFLTRKMIFEHL